jgi:hypothetical protein
MKITPSEPIAVRRVGNSLYIRIPHAFCRLNDIKPGDYLIFDPASQKILRPGDFDLLGRKPVLEPAA